MRLFALLPFIALAACSGEEPAEQKAKEAPASQLQAGQWEITTEVTEFTKADQGEPRLKAEVGTKTTANHCIPEADAKRPPPAMFAAAEDTCSYGNFYMSNGRMNATVECTRPGLSGQIMHNVDGKYTATTLEGTLGTETYLTTDGDVRMSSKLTGRRTGECTAEAAGAETKG